MKLLDMFFKTFVVAIFLTTYWANTLVTSCFSQLLFSQNIFAYFSMALFFFCHDELLQHHFCMPVDRDVGYEKFPVLIKKFTNTHSSCAFPNCRFLYAYRCQRLVLGKNPNGLKMSDNRKALIHTNPPLESKFLKLQMKILRKLCISYFKASSI